MIELVYPYHQGNGVNNSIFKIFTSKPFLVNDIVITQRVELYVKGVKENEEDFMEEHYELDVVVITNMIPGAFMMFDYNNLEITLGYK